MIKNSLSIADIQIGKYSLESFAAFISFEVISNREETNQTPVTEASSTNAEIRLGLLVAQCVLLNGKDISCAC